MHHTHYTLKVLVLNPQNAEVVEQALRREACARETAILEEGNGDEVVRTVTATINAGIETHRRDADLAAAQDKIAEIVFKAEGGFAQIEVLAGVGLTERAFSRQDFERIVPPPKETPAQKIARLARELVTLTADEQVALMGRVLELKFGCTVAGLRTL